jgi:hypothetical protein
MLEGKWWSSIVVYVSILASAYLFIWALIEPLEIPSKMTILGNSVERRLLHVAVAVLVSSHLTLLLSLVLKWRESRSGRAGSELLLSDDMIAAFKARGLCPKKKELIVERVAVKDGKKPAEVFARQVLWALRCQEIDEGFARDLLRGSSYSLDTQSGYVFKVTREE